MNPTERPRRRFRVSLLVLLLLAVVSTIGFYFIGMLSGTHRTLLDSLYITANIFSTVGAWSEQLNTADKVWEILMMIFGIGAAAYALGTATALLTSSEVRRTLGRRQLVETIRNLENHYIVCGFGRMGQSVARELAGERTPFVIIDNDDDKTALADENDYLYLLGDASDESTLRTASIGRAKGLVTCLPHDPDNLFVTLTARDLNEKLMIIARAEQEQTEKRLLKAGADRVICPPVIGALKITRMLLHPAVEDVLEATMARDLRVDKVRVAALGSVSGRTLRDVSLPQKYGVMVLGVVCDDGARLFNPPADHVLRHGDELIVFGSRESVERFTADHDEDGR